MKIKTYIFVLVQLFVGVAFTALFNWSCGGNIKTVPVVTGAMKDDSILDLKEDERFIHTIIENKSEIVFFNTNGKIYRLNPAERMVTFLYDLTFEIYPDIVHQRNLVVFKKSTPNDYVIFDIQKMKIVKTILGLDADKVVCIDDEIIGYKTGNRLVFLHYPTGKKVSRFNLEPVEESTPETPPIEGTAGKESSDEKEVFFNSADMEGETGIVILSSRNLYIFDKKHHSVTAVKLEHRAVSGFLLDGNALYYGSEDRKLVKLNLDIDKGSARVGWSFKIADQIKTNPVKAGSYIVVTPADNNIYFFNSRGTLYWWEKLNSTRMLPPLAIKDNVAVLLWDKTIKYFEYEKKRIITYPLNRYVFSNLLYIDEYIYMIAEIDLVENTGRSAAAVTEEEETVPKSILKVGNNYGVKIDSNPEYIIPVGKSVKFYITKFNLLEPTLQIKIVNPAGVEVFSGKYTPKQDSSFIWIPNKAAVYKMIVEINAENKKGLIFEETFNVIDLDAILTRYFYEVQTSSTEDRVARGL
jgi:hypothetical protein